MLPSFMVKPITRKRFPMVSDHGNEERDFSATPATATIYGDAQPGTGTEDVINRNGYEVVKTVWAQPGSDVQDDDVLVLPDGEFRVNGAPEVWNSGILDHMVIRLSVWVG
ncbi:head-to-tail stopper [Microbacterium phage Celaena]|uniref:head-to-tail stopper n=1 Tax=Microbacterium phage Celaena TaxID=2591214 RepID=UPI0011646178|nr:head-to-tail stopper [Microbacterium phage Celaena]YP_010752335.1 head-to-tail stopper [Microbacterium phage Katzastrophic]QDH92388.1 head-to-tail stopper [Microbacterium phage Celaena]UKH48446.1 head-to-tail stopper [Microbacterium phage Katzastrophic]WNO28724.1 head-to-tail stopper [Microbacterium phage FlameThrower]